MNKILLRFLVTIVILAATILGVWLIWFKPSREMEAFNLLTEVQNDRQAEFTKANNKIRTNTKISDSLKNDGTDDVYSLNDIGLDHAHSVYYGKIAYLRGYMFGFENGVTNTNSLDETPFKDVAGVADASFTAGDLNKFASFDDIYVTVDEAFKYYYSYVQLAEDVSSADAKDIKNLTKELNESYNSFAHNVAEVYAILDTNPTNPNITMVSEVAALYQNLANDYYNVLKDYTALTLDIRDYVVEYVFEGNVTYDAKTVKYELVLNSAKALTSKAFVAYLGEEVKDSEGNLVDPQPYVEFADYLVSAGVITTVVPDSSAITNYATLAKNYADGLTGTNGVFNLKVADKLKVKTEDATAKSLYNEDYFAYVKALADLYV
ncbi:MAG: hypothetical protein IKB42_01645 [Clostridia bacterium]|nr:hypothetical protein [Clostridia bacterium]